MSPYLKPFRRKPKHRKTIGFQTAWRLADAITLIRACSQFGLLVPIGIVLYLVAPGILLLPVIFTLLLLKALLAIMRLTLSDISLCPNLNPVAHP